MPTLICREFILAALLEPSPRVIQRSVAVRGKSMSSAFRFLALLAGLLGCEASASDQATKPKRFLKTETFDRDPGWDGRGNRLLPKDPPEVNQDFGYSGMTNHAGEARGEIGGEVWRSLAPAYYGKAIEERSFESELQAAGSLALLKAQSISGWHTGATIDGRSAVKILPPGEKAKGGVFDRFGVFNMQWANSKWCDVYFDDLSYTTGIEPR
jgi:hypothetical protein